MHSNGFHYDIFTHVHILPHTPLSSEIILLNTSSALPENIS